MARSLIVPFLSALALVAAPAAQSTLHVPARSPTIQAAVTAAGSGDRIIVARGVYEEQVTIVSKDLTLIGRPGAVIRAPVNMAQTLQPASDRRAIVGIFGADVVVRGFEIDGALRGNTNPHFNGIVYLGAGGLAQDCHIHGVRQEPLGPDDASAPLRAINSVAFGTPAVTLGVVRNRLNDNFDGMAFTGDDSQPNLVRIHTVIHSNSVVGSGSTDVLLSQVGIWLINGVEGSVLFNVVRDCNSTVGLAAGILGGTAGIDNLEVPPIEYVGNVLIDNQVGLAALFSRRSLLLGNRVRGSSYAGIGVSGPGNAVVLNTVSNSSIGIGLVGEESVIFGIATDTKVLYNRLFNCAEPIRIETGVTGTILNGNVIR